MKALFTSSRDLLILVSHPNSFIDAPGGLFAVNVNVLAKVTVIHPKSKRETVVKKYYVVDYAGGWSTNNQIISMALKEIELEVSHSLFNIIVLWNQELHKLELRRKSHFPGGFY